MHTTHEHSIQQGIPINSRVCNTLQHLPQDCQQSTCAVTQVNKEPFSGGWLMKVKLSDKGELDSLLDASKYEEHCAKSEH